MTEKEGSQTWFPSASRGGVPKWRWRVSDWGRVPVGPCERFPGQSELVRQVAVWGPTMGLLDKGNGICRGLRWVPFAFGCQ